MEVNFNLAKNRNEKKPKQKKKAKEKTVQINELDQRNISGCRTKIFIHNILF